MNITEIKTIPWAKPQLDRPEYVYVICPECNSEIIMATKKSNAYINHFFATHSEKVGS